MGLSEPYGVWACRPLQLDLDDDDKPHIHLYYTDDESSDRRYRVAINVKSSSAGEKRLAYWSYPNFEHEITERVPKELGFHQITGAAQGPEGYALDYLRGNILKKEDGRLLPYRVPGEDNDLVDHIWAILKKAINDKATVYLWGEQFREKTGIHQIHMNQGNERPFDRENGTWQDGGFMVKSKDGPWHAVFLAFGVQATETDGEGRPISGAPNFARLLGKDAPGTGAEPPGTDTDGKQPALPVRLEIVSAVVNPLGVDGRDNPEIVGVQNPPTAPGAVVVRGWSITNKMNNRSALPDGVVLAPGESFSFAIDPTCPLSNKGGSIALWDQRGHNVDRVQYSEDDASQQGRVIKFEY